MLKEIVLYEILYVIQCIITGLFYYNLICIPTSPSYLFEFLKLNSSIENNISVIYLRSKGLRMIGTELHLDPKVKLSYVWCLGIY